MKKFLFLASTILFFAGCSSDDDVSPVVNPETKNPVATADAVSTSENEELKIAKDFLLENDEIVDLSRISDFDSETTEGGEVVDNRDGTFSYFPPEDFQGEDSFSYDLCVPGSQDRCASAVVTIAVGDAGSPVAEDDSYETNEGSELRINNHLSNDNLIDNAELSSVNSDDTAGTVVLEDDGSITYTPAEGFSGEDTFTYTICDNDEEATCSTATVTLTLVDPVSFNIPSELEDYYDGLAISQNEDLNYKVISDLTDKMHTTILSYGQRHDYLYNADEDLENEDNVILIYSGESRYWEEYSSGNNSYSPNF